MVSKEKEPGMILTRLTGAALEDAIIFKYHHPSIKNISKYQQISANIKKYIKTHQAAKRAFVLAGLPCLPYLSCKVPYCFISVPLTPSPLFLFLFLFFFTLNLSPLTHSLTTLKDLENLENSSPQVKKVIGLIIHLAYIP